MNKLERVLPKIENWVNSNGLKMNLKKTKYMLFANKNAKTYDINVQISNTIIERRLFAEVLKFACKRCYVR